MTWKKEYNQKRQAYLSQKQRERRQKIKGRINNKYYEADSVQVLITFAEYTKLSKGKRLWSDFSATLHEIQQGVSSIIEIMKLRESANNLIRNYRDTAHGKIKEVEHWNNLTDNQQQRLIEYWSRERVRKKNHLTAVLTQQTQDAKQHEKEIERAKYHEERGKENCHCYYCEEKRQIQEEIKAEPGKINFIVNFIYSFANSRRKRIYLLNEKKEVQKR